MKTKKIGWIGTGVMGKSMSRHLISAGYDLNVYTRTRSRAQELLDEGAIWRGSPLEVAVESDIVFTIVGYPEDVRSVYFGEDGILERNEGCHTVVDMTTSNPSLAEEISQIASKKSIAALDAPVSGGDIGAREGKLAIMVGGEESVFQATLPFFEIMGENIAYMGAAGSGQHTKMSNQIKIATTMIGVVESLLYGQKAGLDPDRLLNIIGKGAAGSWSLNNLGKRILIGDFDPGFFIKHFVKDMGIALDEARRMKLALPGLALANQFYTAAMAMGYENLGTQALYKVFDTLNR